MRGLYSGKRVFTVFHLFCGSGGGAIGFKKAGFETLGGIDFDELSCRDFEMFTGVPATQANLHTATTQTIRDACQGQRPDVVFLSPPCKGFSSCLPAKVARTAKYQLMNKLTYLGIQKTLEAWSEPPPLLVMENVPRIQVRGRSWLRRIRSLLGAHGYAIDESTHCCGELGGLAERRQRYLLVARHERQVPEYLYHPEKQGLKAIKDVIGQLPVPLPGSTEGGPMHRLPRLSAKNWLRIATIPAGGDWRKLPEGPVYLDHAPLRGSFGVQSMDEPSATIRANQPVRTSPGAVADCRLNHVPGKTGRFGVEDPEGPSRTITTARGPHDGAATCVADVRLSPRTGRQNGGFGVGDFDGTSRAVVAEGTVRNTPVSVADPRLNRPARTTAYGVSSMDGQAYAVTAAACHDNGPWAIADPRVTCTRREGSLGVQSMDGPSAPVISAVTHHNWPAAVADPRWADPTHWLVGDPLTLIGPEMDYDAKTPYYMVIRALDLTWHRPFTTLELAAIQSFPTRWNGKPLELAGRSHASWRQRIGNAVPPEAAFRMAVEFRITLELSGMLLTPHRTGDVWVRPPVQEMSL